MIPKGEFEEIKAQGLEAFRERIARTAPILRSVVNELRDWEQVKLLSVRMDRLERWYRPGLLCIGDAAHAMSPVGGVGINLAIQDAVAAANALSGPLREGQGLEPRYLKAVQRRRDLPIRVIQGLQALAHRRVLAPAVSSGSIPSPPAPVQALLRPRVVRDLPARIIAFGIWPVHVKC